MTTPLFEPDSDITTGPLLADAPVEPVLDVDEIQGAVLPGFSTSFQHLVGLRFPDASTLRAWLRGPHASVSTLAQVMTQRNLRRAALRARQPRPQTPVMRCVALSVDALRMLTPDADQVNDPAFKGGMAFRSTLLGDPEDKEVDGHRSRWRFGGTPATTPHVLAVLAAEWSFDLDDAVKDLLAGSTSATVLFEQRGELLPGDIEHFGFRDGVSQVGVRGRLSQHERHFLTRRWLDPQLPLARTHARPGQPLVWPGQFVFGYPGLHPHDALEPGPVISGGPAWTVNGSLLALRRLRQDVAAFSAFLAAESVRLSACPGFTDVDADRLAAAMVGRWPDGSALVRNPTTADPADAQDMLCTNAFEYARPTLEARVCSDPLVAFEGLAAPAIGELREVTGSAADAEGLACPAFAHIRKVNPRDLATDKGGAIETLAMQMMRRGITWGSAFTPGEPPDATDRGLLFMSYQTSLVRQFELISTTWMNKHNAPEGNSGHDLLLGQVSDGQPRYAKFSRGDDSQMITATDRWVIPTGGGYFLAPSRSALERFALPEQ
ncbi:hypothetical protein [Nocardia sp. NPDC050710]|uniref:Dyp-type peroxidase n=1 Tax=Nocardia sp. NPDC050710 TaxID=3157220 RepID=UPI0033EAA213